MKEDIERAINKLSNHRQNLLREMDSIDHVLEGKSLDTYKKMIDFAIEKGFKNVCDIGCAFGHQSELCRDRIKYIGINENVLNFYNLDEIFTRYIVQHYPCNLFAIDKETTMAISILALGWNCYKYSENEFDKQFKALSNDFKASLLYVPIENKEILEKYFKNVIEIEQDGELVKTAIYYCNND